MIYESIEKLHQMKIHTMAVAFKEQLDQPNLSSLSFEQRFAMIVDREWAARESKKLHKRLKKAHFRQQASVEDIDFVSPRGLDRSVILSLANCQWIRNHQNVIIVGKTGVGKTYIGEALGNKACREGLEVIRYRATDLFQELIAAKGDGSYRKLRKAIAKADLLIVDDFVILPMAEDEKREFLEIMEDRHDLRATLLTSQLPVSAWHTQIGDPTIADAILDRIVHNAHRINLTGEDSMRRKRATLFDPEPGANLK